MVQVGLNAGPWHARASGFAISYTKNLSSETKIMHDQEIIGAVSFIWQLIKSVTLPEITEHVEQKLREEGLPSIATQNVAEGEQKLSNSFKLLNISKLNLGKGYRIFLGEKCLNFPSAGRGPPESYLSRGYTA